MSSIGVVRVWHFSDEWGVIDSDDTPGGAYVRGYSLRVEAVSDLNQPAATSMGLRPGTEVEFEWSRAAQPIEGLRYLVEQAWPRDTAGARPARQTGAFSTSLWNSVGDPGPDGLTVMREVGLDSLEIPTVATVPVFTAVGTVRLWINDEGWGVIDSDATPGGAWAHYSTIVGTGFRTLTPGQSVEFTYQHAKQDGCDFRAVSVTALDP